MNAAAGESSSKRIVALFPELLAQGGVQQAGRLTVAALNEITREYGWQLSVLSLNDPPEEMFVRTHLGALPMRGFGRSKAGFWLAAAREAQKGGRMMLAAHPNLAVPAMVVNGAPARLKTVVMSHGIEVWSALPALKKYAMQRADLAVAPSRYTAQKLFESQGVAAEKTRLVPWPLSPSFLQLSARPPDALPTEFPPGKVVLTVGRWSSKEKYKGCDELIESLAELRTLVPDVFLVVAGGGDDVPRLQRYANELGVAEWVRFLGKVSEEQLAACYAHAEVFALPSTGEGFGLVFLEAQAFGKPVVGTAVGGPLDLILDGKNGLLVPAHESLVEPLQRLLRDRTLREQMGEYGAGLVRQKYTFPVFQAALEGLLAECGMSKETTEPAGRL